MRIQTLSTALLVAAAILLGSCSKNGPTSPVDNTPASISSLYDVAPDVANCQAGTLKPAEKTKALNYINSIRALHGLLPVVYDTASDESTAQASLIIAANAKLDHHPSPSSHCFTAIGDNASGKSNIALVTWSGSNSFILSTEQVNDLWFKDSLEANMGHRRWMLDPFLKQISFGRVDRAASGTTTGVMGSAIRVIYDDAQDISASPTEFVAYPYHDYPTRLFNSGISMSFSLISDKSSVFGNQNVDFSLASVAIADDSGNKLAVTNLAHDNIGFGIPNNLQWSAAPSVGVRYTVTINNVRVNGVGKNYTYWFKLGT